MPRIPVRSWRTSAPSHSASTVTEPLAPSTAPEPISRLPVVAAPAARSSATGPLPDTRTRALPDGPVTTRRPPVRPEAAPVLRSVALSPIVTASRARSRYSLPASSRPAAISTVLAVGAISVRSASSVPGATEEHAVRGDAIEHVCGHLNDVAGDAAHRVDDAQPLRAQIQPAAAAVVVGLRRIPGIGLKAQGAAQAENVANSQLQGAGIPGHRPVPADRQPLPSGVKNVLPKLSRYSASRRA